MLRLRLSCRLFLETAGVPVSGDHTGEANGSHRLVPSRGSRHAWGVKMQGSVRVCGLLDRAHSTKISFTDRDIRNVVL